MDGNPGHEVAGANLILSCSTLYLNIDMMSAIQRYPQYLVSIILNMPENVDRILRPRCLFCPPSDFLADEQEA